MVRFEGLRSSSLQASDARSVWWRLWQSWIVLGSTVKALASRFRSAAGESTWSRNAASSIASGIPRAGRRWRQYPPHWPRHREAWIDDRELVAPAT